MIYPVINVGHGKSLGSPQPAGLRAYPKLGQTTAVKPDLTQEQVYELAGATIIDSGNKLAAKLSQVYDKYKDVGEWWLAEAATSFFIAGPAGPLYAAADLWWQGRRNNEAVAALEAARKLGNDWMSQMTQDETGWLPIYLDGIEKVDSPLAAQVGYTFDKVNAQTQKIMDLLSDVRSLPPQVVNQFINTVFSGIKKDMDKAGTTLNDLAAILRNLLGAMSDAAKLGKQVTDVAPMVVLAALVAGAAALTLS